MWGGGRISGFSVVATLRNVVTRCVACVASSYERGALWNAGPDGGYSYANAILANVAGDSRRPGTVQSLHPVTSIHGESALLCQVAHDSVEEASTTLDCRGRIQRLDTHTR